MSHKRTPRRRTSSNSMATDQEDRFVALLYAVMRDEVPPGKIESILKDHVRVGDTKMRVYSNDHLAMYAREIVEGLR